MFLRLVAEAFVDPLLGVVTEVSIKLLSHYCLGILLQSFKVRLNNRADVVEVVDRSGHLPETVTPKDLLNTPSFIKLFVDIGNPL